MDRLSSGMNTGDLVHTKICISKQAQETVWQGCMLPGGINIGLPEILFMCVSVSKQNTNNTLHEYIASGPQVHSILNLQTKYTDNTLPHFLL